MITDEPTVAIAFDLNFRHAAEIFSGASDFVAEARLDWQLMPLNFGFESRLMELARTGQLAGALGTFVSDRWVRGLLETGVPAINMFHFSRIEAVPNVGPDDFAIGRAAAEHLRAQAARKFAFFGADGVYSTRLREAGFKVGLDGVECIEMRPGPDFPNQVDALKSESGMIGVFCSTDRCARELITLARQRGMHCGKDLLVVGVDNDPSESIFAGIGISSFKQPIRETGYLAARALHETLAHGGVSDEPGLLTPGPLIPRESSLASNRARIGQRAANFIQENLSDPELDVESLARHVGVSRRSLELATRERFDRTPYQLLSSARSGEARNLLRRTRLPVMEVGIRCGYPEAHHFSAWFKKQCGLAPKAYRKECGAKQ